MYAIRSYYGEGHLAELTADGETVLLVLEESERFHILQGRSVSGLYHFAILVPDRLSLGLAVITSYSIHYTKLYEVCDVEKYYGTKANITKVLNRVSFDINSGEFISYNFV